MPRPIDITIVVALTLWVIGALAAAVPDVQDSSRTPGVRDARVIQDNIGQTICRAGYTAEVRPPPSVTNPIKKSQLAAWGYANRNMKDYEEDHLISLEIGGSPDDERNLWPEHYSGKWGARTKDILEGELKHRICSAANNPDHASLAEAQSAMADNWIEAFDKYVCHRKPKLTAIMQAHC